MFDILVYLYQTHYRPDACPEPPVLMKKLAAVGFDQEDISMHWRG
jgi:Smg protein